MFIIIVHIIVIIIILITINYYLRAETTLLSDVIRFSPSLASAELSFITLFKTCCYFLSLFRLHYMFFLFFFVSLIDSFFMLNTYRYFICILISCISSPLASAEPAARAEKGFLHYCRLTNLNTSITYYTII